MDHTTVTFAYALEIHTDKQGNPRRHEEDVDGDGDTDLVFHFRIGDTDLDCSSNVGMLTGSTFGGQVFAGADDMRLVEVGPRPNYEPWLS